jgi:beta-mannosidase
VELTDWTCARSAPGEVNDPSQLIDRSLDWIPLRVPGTVAAALVAHGTLLADIRDLDADDWWFRCDFECSNPDVAHDVRLDGIATLGDVWLNGEHLLSTNNMFRGHWLDAGAAIRRSNQIVIRCAAIDPVLGRKRPRPAWKTRLVRNQNLRWIRTTLLGRMPSWPPRVPPVGPWRRVAVTEREPMELDDVALTAQLAGDTGIVEIHARLRSEMRPDDVSLVVGGDVGRCEVDGDSIVGRVEVADAERWWPATHGEPRCYPVEARLRCAGREYVVALGAVGFRDLDFGDPDAPALSVNDVLVFCRGGCWSPIEPISMNPDHRALRRALEAARDAGVNMVRIPGTTIYEHDDFYALCDELGILVWQDLMFASMHYPTDDPDFVAEVRGEVAEVVRRLAAHPCVVAICGGSEVFQQAAMLGQAVTGEDFFTVELAGVVTASRPTVAYVPNSPSGGTHPFTVDTGIAHYQGVGGYRRPLGDARRAAPRFVTECLAVSHLPDARTVDDLLGDGSSVSDATWKQGIPRDRGTSWDFEDVRDHYIRELYGIDPTELRIRRPERYLDVGRAATTEMVERTLAEWRRPASPCNGALLMEWNDLASGAGFGLIDSRGRRKPAYYGFKRASQPRALLVSDEGMNGLDLWAMNDTAHDVHGSLRVRVFSRSACVHERETALDVGARDHCHIRVEELLGSFIDITHAYGFGYESVTCVTLSWHDHDGAVVARAIYRPDSQAIRFEDLGLEAHADLVEEDLWRIEVSAERFAKCVLLTGVDSWSDNAFDLEPNGCVVVLARVESPCRARIHAVNSLDSVSVQLGNP